MNDPVTGPLSRETFKALIAAPHGEAVKTIRKYDPMFGRRPGEKIKWIVRFEREVTEIGEATVEASSEEEAEKLGEKLEESEIYWECEDKDPGTLTDVLPKP